MWTCNIDASVKFHVIFTLCRIKFFAVVVDDIEVIFFYYSELEKKFHNSYFSVLTKKPNQLIFSRLTLVHLDSLVGYFEVWSWINAIWRVSVHLGTDK